MVSFDVTTADAKLIQKIVDRAVKMELLAGDRTDLVMDLEAVHANGTPLRLAELLAADTFNFAHDINGIQKHIDRETGGLRNHFLPRFTARL